MANSRAKGGRGEREFCAHLEEIGYPDWRRSQQFTGVPIEGAGDVIPRDDAPEKSKALGSVVRFEVKRYKKSPSIDSKKLADWLSQAEDETPAGKRAVVAMRGNYECWKYVWRHDSGEAALSEVTETMTDALARESI